MKKLKIYAISDLHANIGKFKFVSEFIKKIEPDIVIICGDITHTSKDNRLEYLISKLNFTPIYYVIGNMDSLPIDISISNAINIHLKLIQIGDYYLYGIGGSEYTLDNYVQIAYDELKNIDTKKLILISHIPPYKCRDKAYSGAHIGNRKLRELVQNIQPIIHLCGHVHEDRGSCTIGNTDVINVGPKGCIINIDDNKINFKLID